ncbi:MAG: Mth938-like domain-containing protein [Pseudomonadota bacterium]
MQLNEISYPDTPPIDGYGPGFFRVGGKVYEGGLLILPSGLVPWSGYEDLGEILSAAQDIDVLFVGTGAEIASVPKAMREAVEAAGPGLEIMNTPSACRTYNVLLSEGRRIAVALTPMPLA